MCSPFRTFRGPVSLFLRRLLGTGETGVVYEANLDSHDQEAPCRFPSFALKMVLKGQYESESGQIGRLFNEFRIYRAIEHARRETAHLVDQAVPRCYGMYESEYSFVLVLSYDGKALSEKEWSSLSARDK